MNILMTTVFTVLLQTGDVSAVTPLQRTEWAAARHEQINSIVQKTGNKAQVIFIGDSITQGWESAGATVWEEHFAALHAINLGIGGDRTEHVLWRLDNGNLKGIQPKVAVVMIGTNNFGKATPDSEEEVLLGVVAVVNKIKNKLPQTHVLLLDIFPRGNSFNDMRGSILQVNQALQVRAKGNSGVTYLPIGSNFLERDGSIDKSIMPDYLHLSEEGYRTWANSIMPTIVSLCNGRNPTQPKPSQNMKPKPDLSRGGPWDFDVLVFAVDERGRSRKLETFERAGVPTIAKMADGRLIAAHQWFPENDDELFDTIGVRFSEDNGRSWSKPQPMIFEGLDAQARYPFDPTLVVLEDGRVRLYFTYMVGSRIFEEATPGISSAISRDGIHFVKEDGMRFAIDGEPVIDCAVGKIGNTWHLISPKHDNNTPKGYHATSKDGLRFSKQRELSLDESFKWLGCMVVDGKTMRFFGTRQHGGESRGRGIPAATTTNGRRWKEGTSLNVEGADPGVVILEDGSMVVVTTGPPREGTPSQQKAPGRNQQPKKPKRGGRPPTPPNPR